MVRRRTRAAKSIVSVGENGAVSVALLAQGLGGSAAPVVANGNVLEDQYFASPKRKDCKIDSGGVGASSESAEPLQLVRVVEEQIFDESNKTRKSPSPGKSRPERGGISGRTIGVPLATRSQTRTIDKYFKAKTAANKSAKNQIQTVEDKQKQQQNSTEKTPKKNFIYYNTSNNDEDLAAYPLTKHASNHELINVLEHQQQQQPLIQRQLSLDAASNKEQQQSDFIFDLSEDTTDTDNTELSDEYSTASGSGVSSSAQQPIRSISNFDTHRSPMRSGGDSNSSRSSTTDNIFLQEPVLTLNVDKSPNQASSIKINKTLEIEPIFSSPPAITASALNGRFNKIVSLQCSPIKLRDSFGFEATQPAQPSIVNTSFYALSLDHDNSSSDSGVAFATTTFDTFSPQPAGVASSSTRRRKPATPHRIVCPSPIKAPPRIVPPACVGNIATVASGRKIAGSKVPRQHGANTGSKTRRRLNQPKDQPAPFEMTIVQNGYKQNGHVEAEEHNHHHIKNEPDEQEYENLPDDTDITTVSVANNFCQNLQKSFLHTAVKYETTQQKQQNALSKSHKTATAKVSNAKPHASTIQHQQPKIKLYQPPHAQPLAATNGNHELDTFFQVRRSERKTKTAVKEEMMRNLEQAILEERAEGLKVAHFENKGRGIVSERRFQRGEFVIEYIGDLISMTEAAEREKQYALDENAGCYMYYFKHKNQQYCIDATIDTGKLGRLVNHSRNGNLITKVVVVKQRPHLILIAKDDIEEGEELTYDYGDRSKESLLHHPWLAF